MEPSRPGSELRAYHPPAPHHHVLPVSNSNYVGVHQNGDAEGGVPMPIVEQHYHQNGTIPDYPPIPRGGHGMFLPPPLQQMHHLPPNVQPPQRSSLNENEPQERMHYHHHHQYVNNPPPLQSDHLNDEQAELSTEDFISQGNTESMINDSVNEAVYLATAASSMSINDASVHTHLPHQYPVNYTTSSLSLPLERNIYNFTYNPNQCVTSIPSPHPEGVLDLSKADDLSLAQQFKEEQESSPSPLTHETQYQHRLPDNSHPVSFDLGQGQQASVIVHTANISPSSRSSVPETNAEEYGPFQIPTSSSASPAKDRRFRAFPTNRPPRPHYLHVNHFGSPNLQHQQVPYHHQFNNIMSDIPDQKPAIAANHLTEPVVNYNASPVTSSPHHMWNGGYTTQNQSISPSKSHLHLHSANASQSISAIVDMNKQLSQRHFSEGGEQHMHHVAYNSVPLENHYSTAPTTTTTPTNFSPGTQLQMMHENASYVHPNASTPGPSPKKTKSPRNSGDKMGRGRGIKNFPNGTPGSPDVTAPFQNVQNHLNHQLIPNYSEGIVSVDGKSPKKGRGRGKKVIAKALNISCAESDFGAVAAVVSNVDPNKSLNVFNEEEIQRQVENSEVMKKKRPYKKRAPKFLNSSVDSGGSPEKPITKGVGVKLNRKIKSEQPEMEPVEILENHLPNFGSISRDVLNIEEDLSSPSQMINMGSVGRGKGRGRGVRRSTGEGRGGGVRRSTGEGRGRGVRRSTGEGRGRGGRLQPPPRTNDEIVGAESHMSNVVGMVIPSQQVPWVGPAPGSECPINGVALNNHIGLHQANQANLPKKHRQVIVDGRPLDIPEKIISRPVPVRNSNAIPSNQLSCVQVQMAETGVLPSSSVRPVPCSRAPSAKGQRRSFKPRPKVSIDLYKGSDDEIDSNAEDDEDDEDYEDLERRQRITRRKSGRSQQKKSFVGQDVIDIDEEETSYFDPTSLHMNGLPNEMLVPVREIKKEKDEDPMQEQQDSENVAETTNSFQQMESSFASEDAGMIQNVKQENVEEEAVGDGGTSGMQVDTEGTFGDAESGLVSTTLADVKPVVGLKVKNRRLLSSPQRQLKRPVKRPRIPMRESSVVNFKPRGVEKRGRKKKSVDHAEIVVKTETIETKPKELIEKTETKLVIPKFTDKDKELLYSDKRFVIDISSVDKAPDQIFIWQIIQSENCLRQYYPSKYGEKQFFVSSPVRWYFFPEEFKSDEFYARFLPIVVIIANVIPQPIERRGEVSTSEECTVQYVHVDKTFFVRTLKCIGKIDTIEFLRPYFMTSLTLLTLIALEPLFLSRDFKNQSNRVLIESFKSWDYFKTFVFDILAKVSSSFPFQKEILENLMDYPSMVQSAKDVNKTEACSACRRAVPSSAIKFPTKGHMEKPYDKKTLIELAPDDSRKPPEPLNFCRGCSSAAKKLHRLIHFPFKLVKLLKQNIAKDVATFHHYRTQISDEILLWIQAKDVSWKNVLFLDFQLSVAEVQAEIYARPMVALDAPTPSPSGNSNAVVPNEI